MSRNSNAKDKGHDFLVNRVNLWINIWNVAVESTKQINILLIMSSRVAEILIPKQHQWVWELGKGAELAEQLMNPGSVQKPPKPENSYCHRGPSNRGWIAKQERLTKKLVNPGIRSSYSVHHVTVVLKPLLIPSISYDDIFILFWKSTSPCSIPESCEIWSCCCCPLETIRRNIFWEERQQSEKLI